MFISSPSKSALNGVQAHSLNRRVFHLSTLALKAMIDILCRDGYLLNSTISPFLMCLPTISPILRFLAANLRLPYAKSFLAPS